MAVMVSFKILFEKTALEEVFSDLCFPESKQYLTKFHELEAAEHD